MNPTLATIFPI